jgi:uncharacterized protein
MQFNVSSLLKEHTGATREYDIDEDVRIDGAERRLAGHVRFDRTPDGILVRARLQGQMDAECARCLRPLTLPVAVEFDEEYVPIIDVVSGAKVEAPEAKEDAYRIDGRHVLDLREPIEQYWSMALPMAPLCREDCAGICPNCGEEMAGDGHACTREQVDARWEKLANLELS